MASPVGHVLLGMAVGALRERKRAPNRDRLVLLVACGALGVAADLDFLPGLLTGQPARFHQGPSHSLGAAVVCGGLAALAIGPWLAERVSLRALWACCTGAYASHLALDLLGADGRPPIGLPLLWPLDATFWQLPMTPLPGLQHAASTGATRGEWAAGILQGENLVAIGLEILIAAPLLAIYLHKRRRGISS